MYAYTIYKRGWFSRPEVNWCAIGDFDYTDIKEWEKSL
jgi:hypothetical protein